MGLYSGQLIIRRIFASEIRFGGLISGRAYHRNCTVRLATQAMVGNKMTKDSRKHNFVKFAAYLLDAENHQAKNDE